MEEEEEEEKWDNEYILYMENMAKSFIVFMGETIDHFHSVGFKPKPLLMRAFQDFKAFKDNALDLINLRAEGGSARLLRGHGHALTPRPAAQRT